MCAPSAVVWLSFEFLHDFFQSVNEMHSRKRHGFKVHEIRSVIIPHEFKTASNSSSASQNCSIAGKKSNTGMMLDTSPTVPGMPPSFRQASRSASQRPAKIPLCLENRFPAAEADFVVPGKSPAGTKTAGQMAAGLRPG